MRQILQHVLKAHQRRLRLYADAVQATQGATGYRRAAVLSYLRERETELVAALARYEDGRDDALETWVQSMPAAALEAAARDGDVPLDLDGIVADYRARSDALIQLYEQLADSLVGPPAQAIFADLAQMERTSQKRLWHALLDF